VPLERLEQRPAPHRPGVVDEELEPLPTDEEETPALVGLTMISPNCRRAFEIADHFRARKVKVVAGGPYAPFNLEEALAHVDCVVKGEAEDVWAKCLEDFERGSLQQTYEAPAPCEFKRSPMPRWDLIDTAKMAALPVQVSRGCPFRCEFCLVPEMFGRTMRYREIDDVIREIESLPLKTLFFVDDNITADKAYAAELMKRLQPLGVQWFCMASLELSEHPELLRAMAAAGCLHVLVGLESVNPESLRETQKRQNKVESYRAAIRRFHEAGIEVNASFVVGFDHDTLDSYEAIHQFVEENDLWYSNLNILDVIPGTRLFQRIVAEGRWYGRPSDFSGGMFPVMHYMNVGQLELFDRNLKEIERLFSFEDIAERAVRHFSTGWFAKETPNRDITPLKKLYLSFKLLFIYVLTTDRAKRRLFVRLFALLRKKSAAPGRLVFFLFTVEGAHRQLALLKAQAPRWRETIRGFDKGPWRDRLKP